MEKKYVSMDPWTEALLYIAARKQHLNDVIIPALKEGKIVICDRFMDSTSVYQGYARGLGIRTVDEVQRTVIGSTQPDLTLFFDLTVEEARKRKISRFEESDRLDLENRDFFVKVHEGYQVLIGDNVDRIKVIDAEKPLKNVIEEAFLQIKDKIKDIKESV
ncbi:dTMP kinase [Spiroplasma endosymbiont of Anurida maritima]